MTFLGYGFRGASLIIIILIIFGLSPAADITNLPPFGRDTVLIWEIKNADMESNFVVRIAIFNPDRFIEWESENNQGTVFMPSRDIQEAKGYDSRSLFEGGVYAVYTRLLLQFSHEINYRDVRRRNPHGHPIQLTLELG